MREIVEGLKVLSLFVVGLPRSMTTLVYHQARRALGLSEPAWTTDGELLNNDRFVLFKGNTFDSSEKYLLARRAPRKFQASLAFVGEVAQPYGFAYKDVVNPFVMAAYLRPKTEPVLYIDRDPAEVAIVMCRKGWRYPTHGAERQELTKEALLEGLLRAQRELRSIARVSVRFDDLLQTESSLQLALQQLYPTRPIPPICYRDHDFELRRQTLSRLRLSPEYAEFNQLAVAVAARLEHSQVSPIQS